MKVCTRIYRDNREEYERGYDQPLLLVQYVAEFKDTKTELVVEVQPGDVLCGYSYHELLTIGEGTHDLIPRPVRCMVRYTVSRN